MYEGNTNLDGNKFMLDYFRQSNIIYSNSK